MQSLLSKALEAFLRDRHGDAVLDAVLREADLEGIQLELFQRQPPETILRFHRAATTLLGISHNNLMEDLGTWVCVHPPLEPVRRLFRFSGETFEEMLFSLDAVPARIELAMPGLILPELALEELGDGRFSVRCYDEMPGLGSFLLGVLRAMADDYGTLAFLELLENTGSPGDLTGESVGKGSVDEILIQLLDDSFAAPRAFDLGGAA